MENLANFTVFLLDNSYFRILTDDKVLNLYIIVSRALDLSRNFLQQTFDVDALLLLYCLVRLRKAISTLKLVWSWDLSFIKNHAGTNNWFDKYLCESLFSMERNRVKGGVTINQADSPSAIGINKSMVYDFCRLIEEALAMGSTLFWLLFQPLFWEYDTWALRINIILV